MANSVQRDWNGPDWPLGFIKVVAAGTPVNIMSLVDSANANAPQTATPPATNNANEYTQRGNQIIFQGYQPDTHGMKVNVGNVYIVRFAAANGGGSGNRDDTGVMIGVIPPGGSFLLAAAPLNRDTWSPYRYYLDADNNNDGALVTMIVA